MMLASDLDLRTAGQVLGHSQVAPTARYSHVLADRQSVAAARIEGGLFGARRQGLRSVVVRQVGPSLGPGVPPALTWRMKVLVRCEPEVGLEPTT
jgi:hypothetical protein